MADEATFSHLEPVAANDRVWLQDSPVNLMVVNSVFTIDRFGPGDVEVLRALWDQRVLRPHGRHYGRFLRRIVDRGGRPFWQEDPAFDLERHVFVAPPCAASPQALATRDLLQDYVGTLASQPLPGDRPPWQMQIVPEYRDGMSAVITRVHHVMGDGMALLPVLFSLMDQSGADAGEHARAMAQKISRRTTPGEAVAASLVGPFLLAEKMLWRADRSALHGPELSGEKRVAWTDPLEVAAVKEVKNALGASFNDVLMACVVGGLERHVASSSAPPLRRLRATMPVNMRPIDTLPEMGNRFAAVLLGLPVGRGDVRQRVMAVKRRLDALKRSPEPLFTYGVVNVMLKILPFKLSHGLIDFLANKCTCVISNVPGPPGEVRLAGKKIRGMLFWVPQRAQIGLGISILSFGPELLIGVIADTRLVPEPKALARAFEEEFRGLQEAAGLPG